MATGSRVSELDGLRPQRAGREKLIGLQVVRFFAAAAVALTHANFLWMLVTGNHAQVAGPMDVASAGVDVFFVISGYVIATVGPLAARRPTAWRFYVARWRRVFPVFWAFSLLVAALVILWPALLGRPFAAVLQWAPLAATATLWPVWRGQIVGPIVGPGWTLCLEMIFYSVVALALVGGRLRRNLAIIAVAAAVGLYFRATMGGTVLRVLFSPILLEFAFGVMLATMRGRLAAMDARIGLGAFSPSAADGRFHMRGSVADAAPPRYTRVAVRHAPDG